MLSLTAPFIAVSGNIGAGKSTAVEGLARRLSLPAHLEHSESNPYFGSLEAHALESELWFLTASLQAAREASGATGGIVERPPEEHLDIFAQDRVDQGHLAPSDLVTLQSAYIAESVPPPDLLVHLDVDPPVAVERVRARDRPEEAGIGIDDLARLSDRYESFLRRWDRSPVLRVSTDDLDLRDPRRLDLLCSDVQAALERHLPVSLTDGALPSRTHSGDAGLDLACAEDVELRPLERMVVRTGVAVRIPAGHVGLIVPRSSLAARHGVTQLDGPGIIDSGYRGEVRFILYNTDSTQTFRALAGTRLGQIVVLPFAELLATRVAALTPSRRGTRGLGSSDPDGAES